MTAQISEKLVIDHPDLDVGDRHLYRVVRGDPHAGRQQLACCETIARPNPPRHSICTALYRGHIACYRLGPDGDLRLTGFRYPDFSRRRDKAAGTQDEDEAITGDFWLDLRPGFFRESLYVPFVDGKVVLDRTRWIQQAPRDGHPLAALRRP
jgi:hypothetical protein